MPSKTSTVTQMFPPSPSFTEKQLGDLTGKVVIITGASSGVGYEHAKLLYQKSATVYVATRSSQKANKAIEDIKKESSSAKAGRLEFLSLDLSDLNSVKASADEFLAKESRLDVLIHNAGIMTPPAGSKSNLGHDLEMATNCLGPFLLNHFMEDILKSTAKTSPIGSVRIVWVSSLVAIQTPQGGIHFEKDGNPQVLKDPMQNYMQSKVGNIFLATEVANALGAHGIISVSINPGLMKTELQRHNPKAQAVIMGILFKGPRYGAYTEMFAAFSPAVTLNENGAFIVPWGRFGSLPDHIKRSLRDGTAQKFLAWCGQETRPFVRN